MPWPAISFDKLPGKDALKKYAGESIPCLVVVDANGKVISDLNQSVFERAVDDPGVYRVEAWLTVDGEDRAWIYSNPIYVR